MWPQAVIFDLDGVLTDTAACHYEAWKQMAQRENLYFDRSMNQQLKGVSRMHSLEIILRENGREGTYTPDKMAFLAGWKNEAYQRLLKDLTRQDILPGIAAFLDQLQNAGIKMAVASASENADTVLERLEIRNRFDYVARAKEIKRGKPDPEIWGFCQNSVWESRMPRQGSKQLRRGECSRWGSEWRSGRYGRIWSLRRPQS